MKHIKDLALQILIWSLLGGAVMAGMKIADWAIPNPPREPIQLEFKASQQPAAPRKQHHIEG